VEGRAESLGNGAAAHSFSAARRERLMPPLRRSYHQGISPDPLFLRPNGRLEQDQHQAASLRAMNAAASVSREYYLAPPVAAAGLPLYPTDPMLAVADYSRLSSLSVIAIWKARQQAEDEALHFLRHQSNVIQASRNSHLAMDLVLYLAVQEQNLRQNPT
jgi:hypothetical protein